VVRIPRYQRYYKWREKQWDQLLGDFREHLAMQYERPCEYHLGDMRFERCDDGKLEVADGQQRLVTLSILVAALTWCSREIELDWSAKEYLFTEESSLSGTESVPRISDQLDEWTNLFAIVIAPPDPTTVGDTPFERAYKFFVDGIRADLISAHPAEPSQRLEDLIETVMNRAVLTTATYSNGLGQQSFSRVHTRGEPVSSAEILKAQLMALAANSTDARMVWQHWRTAVEIFEQEPRGLAMWVAADLSDSGAPVRDSEASDIVLRAASDARAANKGVASVVVGFALFAKAWENLRMGKTPSGPQALHSARNIVEQTPLRAQKQLFWLLPAGRHLSVHDYGIYARSVEDTIVVASIVSPFPPDVESFVARVLGNIRDVKVLASPQGIALMAELKAFRDRNAQKFGDKLVYACQHELRSKALETVVRYTEAHVGAVLGGRSTGQGRGDVPLHGTLEHVLPQRLTDAVLEEYGNHAAALRDRFRLGNLGLVERIPNSELSNKTYAEKKAMYAEVPFRVTSSLVHDLTARAGTQSRLGEHLIKVDAWNPDAVQRRSESLYKLACETFDIKQVAPSPLDITTLEPLHIPQANDPEVILAALLALKYVNTVDDVVAVIGYNTRQGNYYLEACSVLGLASNDGHIWTLTSEGDKIVDAANPAGDLRSAMRGNPFLINWNDLSQVERDGLMVDAGLASTTGKRRASTLDSWVRWACFS
jgi:hypothetical protein